MSSRSVTILGGIPEKMTVWELVRSRAFVRLMYDFAPGRHDSEDFCVES